MVSECGEVACLDANWCSHAKSVDNAEGHWWILGAWLDQEASRRKASSSSCSEWCIWASRDTLSLDFLKVELYKDCSQNGSAHQCGNGSWIRFPLCFIAYITQRAGDIPFGEAVLQVSFPQSLVEAMLVISKYSDLFLLHLSSLFIDHNPNDFSSVFIFSKIKYSG